MAFSRRQLARYAVTQLLDNQKPAVISRHLAAALISGKMTKQADFLLDDIAEELESRGLLARAVLTSAHDLSADLKKQLTEQVKKSAGVKEVSLSELVNPELIGGFRVETARHTWDKTVIRRLSEIKGGING